MALFQQRTMLNGSLPFTHIAEVQAVSFTGPEMRIRLISVYPAIELPIYFLPEGGAPGDPLQSREIVEAYYHPTVPRNPFPPEYDPEVDEPPQVPCEYISARYFDVAEKVIVIQDGQEFWVVAQVKPDSANFAMSSEIAHEYWLSQMNGAVFIPQLLTGGTLNFLTESDILFGFPSGTEIPLEIMPYQNYNLVQTRTENLPYPIFVFPREPLVHLSNVNWSWAGGAYNYAYLYGVSGSSHIKTGEERERFWSPSVVFPCKTPDLRLEIQASSPSGNSWKDELPDLEVYVTSSGMRVNPVRRDFVNIDSHVEQVLNITRPWGTVLSNPSEWRTSSWVPPILFAPDDSLANPVDPAALPKPAVSFGFVDYKKTEYNGSRDAIPNSYYFVTGKIYAELKAESLGKPLLNKDDYNYTYTINSTPKDSGYNVNIIDTGVIVDENTKKYTQTVTMNQPEELEQYFDTCTDGTNTLKKKPILKLIYTKTRNVGGFPSTAITIELSINHYINNTLMFTSTFNTNGDGTVWNQRYYYIYSIDLVNKLILAHVYVHDEPGLINRVECVVIDVAGEHILWTYTLDSEIPITAPVNVPPWQLSDDFPAHPYDNDFIGDSGTYQHTEYVWKSPYFNGVGFGVEIGDDSPCSLPHGPVAVPSGVFFPCTQFDEDIRSIILFSVVHYDTRSSVQGYTQQRQHYTLTPRRNGWVAWFRCCYDSMNGTTDYIYGSDIIVKNGANISNGEYLRAAVTEPLKTYEVIQ